MQATRKTIDSGQSIQRVKVGMTGLAFVLLLIGLASAIFSQASQDAPLTAAGAPRADVVANISVTNASDAQLGEKEPLAELGVTPSAAVNTTAPAPAPAK